MSNIQVHRPLTIEQTEVARYLALEQTAAGFTLPSAESSDRHFFFSLPGAVALPAVIYYRTRHTGTPAFSVRINDATVTQYNFVNGDEAERTWHEIVPAHTAGGPTLRPDGNELVFFARDGSVTFGDVVILYASNQTTVQVPIVITTHP
ncbi:hypothetical protein GCM10009798_42310 [Nocardioides panacihumi]|uniref:Uncharacterized protein n=1 Tax=Nocardioides panacihumi TaxID=400774 RepID=A0ABP5DCH2_9ACTN